MVKLGKKSVRKTVLTRAAQAGPAGQVSRPLSKNGLRYPETIAGKPGKSMLGKKKSGRA